MAPDNLDTYSSIFWDSDWARRKYFGWQPTHEDEQFQVLTRRQGPVTRHLVLSQGLDDGAISEQFHRLALLGPLSTVVVHDFSASATVGPPTARVFAGRTFNHVTDRERLMNLHTFVIDLAKDENDLWLAMKTDNRRMCKKAVERGITVTVASTPERAAIAVFHRLYHKLAAQRKLGVLDSAVFDRMFAQGNLLMFSTSLDGEISAVNLVYLTATKAYYLYGVGGIRGDGNGQLLQWETMKHLKARGIRWYDLGGVPCTDDKNGIYLFKKSLGGSLVHLGGEYLHCPPMVSALIRLRDKVRRG